MQKRNKVKNYIVDDVIISTPEGKEFKGFTEAPSDFKADKCDILNELYKQAKEYKKRHPGND